LLTFTSHGLTVAFNDPIEGLYTSNASAALGNQQGIRQMYKFGLYSYCAYVDTKHGTCSNHTIADRFQPYQAITADMSTNYSQYTDAIYQGMEFQNNSYLGSSSQGAYWMLLLGTLCATLALSVSVFFPSLIPVRAMLNECLSILEALLNTRSHF